MRRKNTSKYLASQGLSERVVINFWNKVKKKGSTPKHMPHLGMCWSWKASTTAFGYGKIWSGASKKLLGAHVVSWILHHGPIPNKLHVLHQCDNPPCCNPNHLFIGTAKQNIWDRILKGRSKWTRGEDAHNSKLKNNHVLAIRCLYEQWNLSEASIGRLFKVSERTVSGIVTRTTWRHI